MKGLFEAIDDKEVILEKLIEKPQLCMLLNENLPLNLINQLEQIFYVVEVEYENKMRAAVVCGYYRHPISNRKE